MSSIRKLTLLIGASALLALPLAARAETCQEWHDTDPHGIKHADTTKEHYKVELLAAGETRGWVVVKDGDKTNHVYAHARLEVKKGVKGHPDYPSKDWNGQRVTKLVLEAKGGAKVCIAK